MNREIHYTYKGAFVDIVDLQYDHEDGSSDDKNVCYVQQVFSEFEGNGFATTALAQALSEARHLGYERGVSDLANPAMVKIVSNLQKIGIINSVVFVNGNTKTNKRSNGVFDNVLAKAEVQLLSCDEAMHMANASWQDEADVIDDGVEVAFVLGDWEEQPTVNCSDQYL